LQEKYCEGKQKVVCLVIHQVQDEHIVVEEVFHIIAICIEKEILGASAWGDFQMILASFFIFSFFWEWATSQHVAILLDLRNK